MFECFRFCSLHVSVIAGATGIRVHSMPYPISISVCCIIRWFVLNCEIMFGIKRCVAHSLPKRLFFLHAKWQRCFREINSRCKWRRRHPFVSMRLVSMQVGDRQPMQTQCLPFNWNNWFFSPSSTFCVLCARSGTICLSPRYVPLTSGRVRFGKSYLYLFFRFVISFIECILDGSSNIGSGTRIIII